LPATEALNVRRFRQLRAFVDLKHLDERSVSEEADVGCTERKRHLRTFDLRPIRGAKNIERSQRGEKRFNHIDGRACSRISSALVYSKLATSSATVAHAGPSVVFKIPAWFVKNEFERKSAAANKMTSLARGSETFEPVASTLGAAICAQAFG